MPESCTKQTLDLPSCLQAHAGSSDGKAVVLQVVETCRGKLELLTAPNIAHYLATYWGLGFRA